MDDYDCQHPKIELRKRTFSNGSIHYLNQCLKCGHPVGEAISKWKIKDINKINDFDEELLKYWDKLINNLFQQKREEDKKQQKKEFDEWYSEYLQSDKWKQKREMVLKRENYFCQGCRINEALIVHHMTYQHVGDELLFELIALCEDCHKRCHED